MTPATSIPATPLSQPCGEVLSKSPALGVNVSFSRSFENFGEEIPVNGSSIEDACHPWAWRVADSECPDIAFIAETVLAKRGVHPSSLNVAFRVGNWLAVRHVPEKRHCQHWSLTKKSQSRRVEDAAETTMNKERIDFSHDENTRVHPCEAAITISLVRFLYSEDTHLTALYVKIFASEEYIFVVNP